MWPPLEVLHHWRRKIVLPCSCHPLGVEPDCLHLEMEWGSELPEAAPGKEECFPGCQGPWSQTLQMREGRYRLWLNPNRGGTGGGVLPLPSTLPTHRTELTIAKESRGAGTLEVVILAEVTLVAAFTVAHTTSALALAVARAWFVLTLTQAGLRVTQGTRGAVAGFATPEGGTGHYCTAWEEALDFYAPILQTTKLRLHKGGGKSMSCRQQ